MVSPLGNCVFQKLLPWHFLTNRQIFSKGIVLLCTLVQSFCFHNVLFCPASHLILINTPSEMGGKRIIIHLQKGERKLRLPFWFSSVVSEHSGLSLTLANRAPLTQFLGFLFFSSLTFPIIPVDSTCRHITNTADHLWLTERLQSKVFVLLLVVSH